MSSETKVIVVIGSVTAKEYEPLRLEQLRLGNKVKIERLSNDLFLKDNTLGDLDLDSIGHRNNVSGYEMFGHDSEDESVAVDVFEILQEEIFRDYNLNHNCIAAVIVGWDMLHICYDPLRDDYSKYLFDHIFPGAKIAYTIQPTKLHPFSELAFL